MCRFCRYGVSPEAAAAQLGQDSDRPPTGLVTLVYVLAVVLPVVGLALLLPAVNHARTEVDRTLSVASQRLERREN